MDVTSCSAQHVTLPRWSKRLRSATNPLPGLQQPRPRACRFSVFNVLLKLEIPSPSVTRLAGRRFLQLSRSSRLAILPPMLVLRAFPLCLPRLRATSRTQDARDGSLEGCQEVSTTSQAGWEGEVDR